MSRKPWDDCGPRRAGPRGAGARIARCAVAAALAATAGAPASGGELTTLRARELARFAADAARQGVAVDAGRVYAVSDREIAAYDRKSGARVASWRDEPGGPVHHLNSCSAQAGRLVCAHSNYPNLPMASRIEFFRASDLARDAPALLPTEDGSLTWIEPRGDGWLAGFAHYDGRGGAAGRDHRDSYVAHLDAARREVRRWRYPATVLERLAPRSASGGSVGPDGLLYVSGHDRGELYALRLPDRGARLEHLATVAIDIGGQAFAWDRSARGRVVYGIDRGAREVRAFEIPPIPGVTR